MKVLQARLPNRLYGEIEELVTLGLFKDRSEVITAALKRMLAEESREYLRDLARTCGFTERSMLRELKSLRA